MKAATQRAARAPTTTSAIEEIERLSRAQLEAATAGQFEEVWLLLGTRQPLLEGLRGVGLRPGELDTVKAVDAETLVAIRAEIRRVEERLSQFAAGSRALSGYRVRTQASPAFVDDAG